MRKPQVRVGEVLSVRVMRVLLSIIVLCVLIMSLETPNLFKPRLVSVSSSRSDAQKSTYDPPPKTRRHLADPKESLDEPLFSDTSHSTSESSKSGSSSTSKSSMSGGSSASKSSKPGGSSTSKSSKSGRSSTVKWRTSSTPLAAASLPSPGSSAGLIRAAESARIAGRQMWELVETKRKDFNSSSLHRLGSMGTNTNSTKCPQVLIASGDELRATNNVMVIPCGLTSGSSITLVGRPLKAHSENSPHIRILTDGEKEVMVSQFMVELRGLKLVDGEDPPRILHVNPRLKGDWSSSSVIELNTCYRGQWGTAQRCEGWLSSDEEENVDGLPKCERWQQDDGSKSNTDTKKEKSSWLNKWIPKPEKGGADWSYPFKEERLFVMTIRAGWEGYHVSVDGRHITSFPYRTGFILEEATGFAIAGDVEVRSIVGTSLPSTHTSLSSEQLLEESEKYKAPPLPTTRPVHLFIGILSASNHFAERMAVRKTWMQSSSIQSSQTVARFFVALHADLEINLQVREEAEYFGDMVILPFIDHYDLVVLKTVAICEYAVRNVSANYIMKTDDDTFVRVDTLASVLSEKVREAPGLYMGNINQFHRPLREGKWAVTYEEWPEEEYPPYANGPGYIISSDIAKYILAQERNNTLRLFKMEDVSMGMWVLQFNADQAVHYVHNLKFCQWGCIEEYYTAHYQSPRQMLCMWDKLQQGEAQCCNMR